VQPYEVLRLTRYQTVGYILTVAVISSVIPIDQTIEEAARERPGLPIRIRVQPTVLRQAEGKTGTHYASWRNLHWTIEVPDLVEARQLREALSAFFYVAAQRGVAAAHDALLTLVPSTQG
jgi:hypothetical protein